MGTISDKEIIKFQENLIIEQEELIEQLLKKIDKFKTKAKTTVFDFPIEPKKRIINLGWSSD